MAKTVKTDISRNDQAIQDPFSQKLIKNHQNSQNIIIHQLVKSFVSKRGQKRVLREKDRLCKFIIQFYANGHNSQSGPPTDPKFSVQVYIIKIKISILSLFQKSRFKSKRAKQSTLCINRKHAFESAKHRLNQQKFQKVLPK